MKVLVTGANGFVGKALSKRLLEDGHLVVGAVRNLGASSPAGHVAVGEVGPDTDWHMALSGCDAVVHCAARAHIMRDDASDKLAAFRTVNTAGTLNLAKQATNLGLKRFIFISSVKVNGEATPLYQPFLASDTPHPEDPYGISKMEAEQGLQALAAKTGLEVVIIRPPLVYGPGVKANFQSMLAWVAWGVPLPLGAITNLRSLVALDNLIDLVARCLSHPAAASQIFMVSDGEDVSTPDLLRKAAFALGKKPRLFAIPATLLHVVAGMFGCAQMAQRLCGSLQVDIENTRQVLGWTPPLTLDEGLRRAVEGLREKNI